MGYRSDVALAFYADNDENWPPMRLWLNAYKPRSIEADSYRDDEGKHRIIVQFFSVKWYESYGDVQEIMTWYTEYISNFEGIGGCSEYVRLGEEVDDIVTEYNGDNVQYILGVMRDISID
jgi:hypothetical protein